MLCPGGGSQPRTVFPVVAELWDTRMEALLAIRTRQSRSIPWVAATKTGVPDVGMGHQMHIQAALWESLCSGAWKKEYAKIATALQGLWKGL